MKIAIAINIDGQSCWYLFHSPNHLYDLSGITYPHLLILKLGAMEVNSAKSNHSDI